MRIFISDKFNDELPGKLKTVGELTTNLEEAEVVVIRSKTKCKGDWFDSAPNCSLIVRGGVGLDNVDLEEAASRGIQVHNTPGVSVIAVAELTMGLLLAAANSIVYANTEMGRGLRPRKGDCPRVELHGKTLGLIGYGDIGKHVARLASGFGMDVLVHDPYVDRVSINGYERETVSLEEVLKNSEFITLHVPLTDETKGLIAIDTLPLMEKCEVLVNTSRAGVVDEADLLDRLYDRDYLYYATDVLADDSLLGRPEVIVTPHIGAQTPENMERTVSAIVDRVRKYYEEVASETVSATRET